VLWRCRLRPRTSTKWSPGRSLFSRARRDFSHGCIRLEDATGLAEFVLRDEPEWTRKNEAAMQGDQVM